MKTIKMNYNEAHEEMKDVMSYGGIGSKFSYYYVGTAKQATAFFVWVLREYKMIPDSIERWETNTEDWDDELLNSIRESEAEEWESVFGKKA